MANGGRAKRAEAAAVMPFSSLVYLPETRLGSRAQGPGERWKFVPLYRVREVIAACRRRRGGGSGDVHASVDAMMSK